MEPMTIGEVARQVGEAGLRRASALKRLLQAGMRCECVRIEDCFLDDCSAPGKGHRSLPIVSGS